MTLRTRAIITAIILPVLVFLFCWIGVVFADHTKATSKDEIDGMPAWCCDVKDCAKADVKLLGFVKGGARILVEGKEYLVIGITWLPDSPRTSGIFTAPGKTTTWCHLRGNKVRCATVKPRDRI